MARETSLSKKYEKWEHIDDDDDDEPKQTAAQKISEEEIRRQLARASEVNVNEEANASAKVQKAREKAAAEKAAAAAAAAGGGGSGGGSGGGGAAAAAAESDESAGGGGEGGQVPLIEEMDSASLGEAGLGVAADNYVKALEIFLQRDGEMFLMRWNQMALQMRMNVVDVTFDAMLNHVEANTAGFRLSREDYFILCPELAPEGRRQLARDPSEFPTLCQKTIKTTKKIAKERLRKRRAELQEVTLELGSQLQYQIVIGDEEAEGSLEVYASVYRLLVAETLVCTFEALTGRKAAEMPHMRDMPGGEGDDEAKPKKKAAETSSKPKDIASELD